MKSSCIMFSDDEKFIWVSIWVGRKWLGVIFVFVFFFFSSRRRHTRWNCDWSSDVCSSDLRGRPRAEAGRSLQVIGVDLLHDRSEERRVGKSVDLGGRRIIKKKKKK